MTIKIHTRGGEIVPAAFDADGRTVGHVHSFEVGAAVDGPGIRFALFVSGCQFRCLYCHNPDTWKLNNGRLMTVDEVVNEIGKYASFLRRSGGLTISGGEPLMQAHFIGEIYRRVKQHFGLHTALDTQGFLAGHLPDSWFDAVDLVLLDIKHIDPVKYEALTSKPLQPTLDFAERLMRMKKTVWIRYVLVPGLTDDAGDVDRLARYLKKLAAMAPGCIERIEVLPFHKMGEFKWRELGLDYQLDETTSPDKVMLERVRAQLSSSGLLVC